MLLETVQPSVSNQPFHFGGRLHRAHCARGDASRTPRVLLASKSPRRRLLLTEAGIDHEVIDSGVDDGQLAPGAVRADQWVAALAYLKAAAAASKLCDTASAIVLGADTVVVDDGEIIGQPRDAADAERILRRLANGEHDVVTGVALIDPASGTRDLMVDSARVRVGVVSDASIAEYLTTAQWRGKAGAYNLSERLAAGWPIEYDGDPGTIMGLPIRRLRDRLAAFMAHNQ